jgi:hypothetical protein
MIHTHRSRGGGGARGEGGTNLQIVARGLTGIPPMLPQAPSHAYRVARKQSKEAERMETGTTKPPPPPPTTHTTTTITITQEKRPAEALLVGPCRRLPSCAAEP